MEPAEAPFEPVIVCGVGRSGTTLLQTMLAAHPQLCLPPETAFFRKYVANGRRRRSLEKAGPKALVELLARDEEFARAGIPPAELLSAWLREPRRPLQMDEVYRQLLLEFAYRDRGDRGPALVGDKDPKNIEFLPELAAAYPQARVLHIVRDPRAVLASRMKAAWSRDRPWWMHPLVQSTQWRCGRRQGPRLFGARWMELRYEDLLADPEGKLREVCAHLGLDFDPAMLNFADAARRLVAPSELDWKRNNLGPLQTGNANKWRSELGPREVAWVETVCAAAMRTHGYTAEAPSVRRLLNFPLALAATAAFRALFSLMRWSRR